MTRLDALKALLAKSSNAPTTPLVTRYPTPDLAKLSLRRTVVWRGDEGGVQ